jgi:hypothetical protein
MTQTCRRCGCDDTHPCDPPCAWVAPDLCSRCCPELDPAEILAWGLDEMFRGGEA